MCSSFTCPLQCYSYTWWCFSNGFTIDIFWVMGNTKGYVLGNDLDDFTKNKFLEGWNGYDFKYSKDNSGIKV